MLYEHVFVRYNIFIRLIIFYSPIIIISIKSGYTNPANHSVSIHHERYSIYFSCFTVNKSCGRHNNNKKELLKNGS